MVPMQQLSEPPGKRRHPLPPHCPHDAAQQTPSRDRPLSQPLGAGTGAGTGAGIGAGTGAGTGAGPPPAPSSVQGGAN